MKQAAHLTDDYTTGLVSRIVPIPVLAVLSLVLGRPILADTVLTWEVFPVLTAEVLILTATTILLTRAFRLGDASRVGPLLSLVPVAVVPTSYLFLDETPTLTAGIGVAFVAIGGYALTLDHGDTWRDPLRYVVGSEPGRLLLIVVALSSVVPVLDKIGAGATAPFTWAVTLHVGLVIGVGSIWFWVAPDRPEQGRIYGWLLLGGAMNAGIWIFQLSGYLVTNVAYITALKRVSILLTVIGGGFLFNEVAWRRRLGPATVMMLGGILIGTGL